MSAEIKGEVAVLGTGTMLNLDYTRRFEIALGRASKIMTIIKEPPSDWLPHALQGKEIYDLSSLYTNYANRGDNYERVAQQVVGPAAKGERVAYVTYGSPVVYDRVTSLIRMHCERHGIPCVIVAAVSSIDSILGFLGEDLAPGLQICEARWLEQNRIKLDPNLAALLFQIGAFWTDGIPTIETTQTSKLEALTSYLLQFYPPRHSAVFIRAPSFEGDAGYMRVEEVGRLDRGRVEDLFGTSLYIPSLSDPGVEGRIRSQAAQRAEAA